MADKMRLIDANALRTQFDDIPSFVGLTGGCVQQFIDKAHTVDAVEVVHGQWKKRGNETTCSVCRFIYYANRDIFNYCPNCGAKMDAQRLRKPVKEVTVHHIGDFEDKQESGLLEEE